MIEAGNDGAMITADARKRPTPWCRGLALGRDESPVQPLAPELQPGLRRGRPIYYIGVRGVARERWNWVRPILAGRT